MILKVVDIKDTSKKGTDSERYDWNANFHPQRHMRTFNYLWKRTCAHGYSNTELNQMAGSFENMDVN